MSFIELLNEMTPAARDVRLGNLIAAAAPYAAFTRGDFYFVDQSNGNDAFGGKDIRDAFKSIQKAINVCSGVVDDYIFVLPTDGVDYTGDTVGASLANAYIYLNKSNVHLIGLNPGHMGSVIVKPGAAATAGILNLGNGADRCEIAGLTFDTTTAANECIAVTGGADNVWVHDNKFVAYGETAGAGIVGTNVASCDGWVIERNTFLNCTVAAILGYFHDGVIRNNRLVKTVTGALTIGISLLDNTTTADSDGCLVENNIVGGGIVGTTPLADGISVAAACYGVLISNNLIGGCTDNLTMTENTAAAHAFNNKTYDQGEGFVAYATLDDKLPQ